MEKFPRPDGDVLPSLIKEAKRGGRVYEKDVNHICRAVRVLMQNFFILVLPLHTIITF